ncbi:MAG: glycosyltransferase family 4 protein [Planctomycetes bacterium]|nr:glycosyltransferase family 4 protein [Planctomycetota bacterium]
MRILLGIETLGLIGGSERYGLALARALAERGHEVAGLCARRTDGAPEGLRVLEHASYADDRARDEDLAPLLAEVRACEPDIVLLLSGRSRALTRALLGVRPSLPLVRFVQDHTLFCPGLNKLHADASPCTRPMGLECLARYYTGDGCFGFRRELHASALDGIGGLVKHQGALADARRGARLVVASHYMRRELLAVGCEPERVDVVPYFTHSASAALEPREPAKATRDFVLDASEPVLFAPARLALPDKGVDFLLTALSKLATPFRAVIAGSGPAEEWLRTKARDEGLGERVHFAGWQDAASIEWLYAHAAVVAFPSVWDEPFGLVGIEAMAHQKPVVAFDVGGVREWLVEGETGFAVARRDTDAFARALERVLGDRALAARLGRGGRERVETEFRATRHLERLEAVLERALDQ